MNLQRRRPEELEINLTPLIDVVFLLLIFFMVSTTFVQESKIELTLPESSKDAPQQEADTIEVAIDINNTYFVAGKPLAEGDVETLEQAIREAAQGLKDPSVVLSADDNTTYQAVIDVLDAARSAGNTHVTFATSSRQPETQ